MTGNYRNGNKGKGFEVNFTKKFIFQRFTHSGFPVIFQLVLTAHWHSRNGQNKIWGAAAAQHPAIRGNFKDDDDDDDDDDDIVIVVVVDDDDDDDDDDGSEDDSEHC